MARAINSPQAFSKNRKSEAHIAPTRVRRRYSTDSAVFSDSTQKNETGRHNGNSFQMDSALSRDAPHHMSKHTERLCTEKESDSAFEGKMSRIEGDLHELKALEEDSSEGLWLSVQPAQHWIAQGYSVSVRVKTDEQAQAIVQAVEKIPAESEVSCVKAEKRTRQRYSTDSSAHSNLHKKSQQNVDMRRSFGSESVACSDERKKALQDVLLRRSFDSRTHAVLGHSGGGAASGGTKSVADWMSIPGLPKLSPRLEILPACVPFP